MNAKKNSCFTIVLIIFSLLLSGWNCNSKVQNQKKEYQLKYYLQKYPTAKKEYDTLKKITTLNFYNDDSVKEESLDFYHNNSLLAYTFYNSIIHEPCFSILFDLDGKMGNVVGKPLFVASEYFKKDRYATDSFYVQIYLATPPTFKSEFSVYEILDLNKIRTVASHQVKDNRITALMGKVNKQKGKEKYYVISKLVSKLEPTYIRTDTVYFEIKVDSSKAIK